MNKKIKKIIVAIIGTMFLFSACGNTEKNVPEKSSVENKNQQEKEKKEEENKEEENKAEVDEKEFARERSFMALGTFITLKAMDGSREDVLKALDESVELVNKIEDTISVNIEESEISNLNRNSGKSEVEISEVAIDLIKRSMEYSWISEGAFDPTIYPIVKLWGIGTDDARIPSNKEIEKNLELTGYRNLKLNEEKETALIDIKGGGIDLGGIAKGYIADRVKEIFKNNNITSGFLNFGGNILVIGEKLNGDAWRIGVRNPHKDNGEYLGIVQVTDKTVVTSGNYERYFEQEGERYHHIIDPKTGYPVNNNLASISIIGEKSVDADALSTTVYVLGLDKGMKLLESLEGVEGIFVTKDNEVYVTSGIKDTFKVTDGNFEIKTFIPKEEEKEKIDAKEAEVVEKKETVEVEVPKPKVEEEPKVIINKDEVDGNSEATD